MRSESDSSAETDSLKEPGPGDDRGSGIKKAPAWQIVEAGESNSFAKEFAEPILILMASLLKKEVEAMEQQIKREKYVRAR
jgi:hypothetical protein